MDRDLMLLAGLVFLPLAFVAFVAAWADRRRPLPGLILLGLGVAMIGWAQLTHPAGGYDWREVPEVVLETVARLFR